jgi:hypothetical protein
MRIRAIRTTALIAVVSIIATVAVEQALAAIDSSQSTTVTANMAARRITAVREDIASTTTSTTFVTLATASITIPSGQSGLITAQFTGESLCNGSGGWCSVRLLIDGTEMVPQSNTDFAFDSPGTTNDWESHTVERTWSGAAAGAHTISLQWAVISGATSFRVDDWVLDVEFWRQS